MSETVTPKAGKEELLKTGVPTAQGQSATQKKPAQAKAQEGDEGGGGGASKRMQGFFTAEKLRSAIHHKQVDAAAFAGKLAREGSDAHELTSNPLALEIEANADTATSEETNQVKAEAQETVRDAVARSDAGKEKTTTVSEKSTPVKAEANARRGNSYGTFHSDANFMVADAGVQASVADGSAAHTTNAQGLARFLLGGALNTATAGNSAQQSGKGGANNQQAAPSPFGRNPGRR